MERESLGSKTKTGAKTKLLKVMEMIKRKKKHEEPFGPPVPKLNQ